MAIQAMPGVNIMLIGPSGSGKTTSIKTLIAAGITPFCVFTEPGFEVLGDIPPDKLHWNYIPSATQSFESMMDASDKINSYSFESLTKMVDQNRKQYRQFIDLLTVLNKYTCQRDGKDYGDVTKWGTDRALVIDSLSGINAMVMNLMVGAKPVRNQADWGVAQNNLENLVNKLCMDTKCHFVLVGHVERETDEVLGGSKIMISTLGKKLAPKLPRFFSDVILSVKDGAKFSWSTANPNADLKARNLPIADGLPPDFKPIIDNWKKQGGVIAPTV